jgi:hypothetical protein
MSAHWYWDWSWGGQGGTGGGSSGGKHHSGDFVPEKMGPERGPCRKTAKYKTTTDSAGNNQPTSDWSTPPAGWQQFILKEVDANDNDLTSKDKWEYYWATCENHNKTKCCKGGGCQFYETRMRHPTDTKRYITDFKCKCIN